RWNAADINQALAVMHPRQHSRRSLPKQRRQGFIKSYSITRQRIFRSASPAHTPRVFDDLAAHSLCKRLRARKVLRGVQMQGILDRIAWSINACFQRVEPQL